MQTKTARLALIICGLLVVVMLRRAYSDPADTTKPLPEVSAKHATAVFGGGCFWCVETDFEKCPGVLNVISGYTGGRSKNPTYKNYSTSGHREVVFVVYDPKEVSYAGLVEWLVKHIDPTNGNGQFNDRGKQYAPAIYYANKEEKAEAERVLAAIEQWEIFQRKMQIDLEPREEFWPAEEYHQDYHRKNGFKYGFFRTSSGRDRFINHHWGSRAKLLELPGAQPEGNSSEAESDDSRADSGKKPWLSFRKPPVAELKRKLNATQFRVSQQDGTEPQFRNQYWDNKRKGIYVDIVSGAPLFSSSDKYKSGTGWPSFVKPIEPEAVLFKVDRTFFSVRTEVRSRYGDSHLGHVFDDGPPDRGGKRYCMNSAAMRFIPKEEMEAEGYGDYLHLVK